MKSPERLHGPLQAPIGGGSTYRDLDVATASPLAGEAKNPEATAHHERRSVLCDVLSHEPQLWGRGVVGSAMVDDHGVEDVEACFAENA